VLDFRPEVWVHLIGPDGETVDLPVYPSLTVCADCGASRFAMPPTEMLLLQEAVSRDSSFCEPLVSRTFWQP